jgi:hypothetical protein
MAVTCPAVGFPGLLFPLALSALSGICLGGYELQDFTPRSFSFTLAYPGH